MFTEIACDALRQKKVLELVYDGFSRCVEVHAVGFSKERQAIMRVWQVSGGSHSESIGWKLMRLDEARSVVISKAQSLAPRQGYKKGDKGIHHIICEY